MAAMHRERQAHHSEKRKKGRKRGRTQGERKRKR